MQILQEVLPSQEKVMRGGEEVVISRKGYTVVRCNCGCLIRVFNLTEVVCPNCNRAHGLLMNPTAKLAKSL